MLSAIEKKDNETIALIRAKHEGVMQNLVMEIKKKQLEEAQKNIESLAAEPQGTGRKDEILSEAQRPG